MKFKQLLIDQSIIHRNSLKVSWPLRRLRASNSRPIGPKTATRFVIIPADTSNPSGSLGDMAMFTALMQSLRKRNSASTFTVIGTHNHSITVPDIGEVPVISAWVGKAGTVAFDKLIRQSHALFVVGADILDGKYGAALVQRIVSYSNHSVALGIPATILGFSFNHNPRRSAIHALAKLHPQVTVNLRDQPSLDRFVRFTGISATLCADSAFLMQPTTHSEPEAEAWIAAMRSAGRAPVGVNLNAHALAPALAQVGMGTLIAHIANQLKQAGEESALSYMLIPHDFKAQSADITMLQELDKQLHKIGFKHVRYTPIYRPDDIKRIVGQLDLVITGRMHLAIASLGAGTPVLSITYQDKFEGLYQHFDLSLEQTITPIQCLGNAFLKKVSDAFEQRNENRERILTNLPRVKELASRNLMVARC